MSATAPIDTRQRAGGQFSDPVAAATMLFAGILVALNATGYAVQAADAAGLKVRGVAQEDQDNSGGADGDLSVVSRAGVFLLSNSVAHALTRAHIGSKCFVEDFQTVSSNGGTNNIVAGIVVDIDALGVWVLVEGHETPTALALTAATVATTNAVDLATAEALANALKTALNAAIADIASIKAVLVAKGLAK